MKKALKGKHFKTKTARIANFKKAAKACGKKSKGTTRRRKKR